MTFLFWLVWSFFFICWKNIFKESQFCQFMNFNKRNNLLVSFVVSVVNLAALGRFRRKKQFMGIPCSSIKYCGMGKSSTACKKLKVLLATTPKTSYEICSSVDNSLLILEKYLNCLKFWQFHKNNFWAHFCRDPIHVNHKILLVKSESDFLNIFSL